jgi:GT2 family glycosyltransferase
LEGNKLSVGIVILNWNGIRYTIACLDSLICADLRERHIVVIDNGSVDNSQKKIIGWASKNRIKISKSKKIEGKVTIGFNPLPGNTCLEIICLDRNLGYGGGNNVGIKHLIKKNIDYIFILNNDTEIFPDTIDKLELFLNRNQQAGIVGCDILDIKSRTQLPTGRMDYWLGVHFLKKFKKGLKGKYETNFVPGCAMLVRKEIFDLIGGFNEEYFLYADDIEFCYRVRKHGWKLYMDFDAKILAHVSASSGGRRNPIYYYFVVRNTMRFIVNELIGIQKIIAILFFLGGRVLQIIQWAAFLKYEHILAATKGFEDFYKGVSGKGYAKKYLSMLESIKTVETDD